MDCVGGVFEVSRTEDTHEIVMSGVDRNGNPGELNRVVLSSRHARYLASVLLEHAAYAEAEAKGLEPGPQPYHRRSSIELP